MNSIKLIFTFAISVTLAGFLLSGCSQSESQEDAVGFSDPVFGFFGSHRAPFEPSENIVVVSDVDVFTTGISFYFQNNSDYVFRYHLLDWSVWSYTAQGWRVVYENAPFNSAMPMVGTENHVPQRAGFNTDYSDFELLHGKHRFVRRFMNEGKDRPEFLIVEFEIDGDVMCPVELSITRPRYDAWAGLINAPPLIGKMENNYKAEKPTAAAPHPLAVALREYMEGNIEVWNTYYEFRISNDVRSAELVTLDDIGTVGVLLEIDDGVMSKVLLYMYNDELFYRLTGWVNHGAFGAGRYNRLMSDAHGQAHVYTLESGRIVISTYWVDAYRGWGGNQFRFNGQHVTEDEFNTLVESALVRYGMDGPWIERADQTMQILVMTITCDPALLMKDYIRE